MEVKKKILAIFRIIEASPYEDKTRYNQTIENLEKLLSPQDKKVMADVMKAYLLLTAGNQKAVRDPSSYDEDDAFDDFSSFMSQKTRLLHNRLKLPFDITVIPTRADYEIARKLLSVIGSASVTKDDIDAQIGSTGDLDRRFASEGYDTVYRGLNRVSKSVIKFLMSKRSWNIKRGVSTSYDINEAYKFAKVRIHQGHPFGSTLGPSILFTINNVSRRGFNAGSLSRYSGEKEVILSGELQITDYNLEMGAEVLTSDGDRELIKILAKSKEETVGFWWHFPGKREPKFLEQTFPDEFGESFDSFLKNLIDNGGGIIIVDDEELEIEIVKRSILIKVNATLP
jgi:hypothetical protein